MFSKLDAIFQKELLDFVRAEEADKEPKPLRVSLVAELLRQIIGGDRVISGMVRNDSTGDIFVRFSFAEPPNAPTIGLEYGKEN